MLMLSFLLLVCHVVLLVRSFLLVVLVLVLLVPVVVLLFLLLLDKSTIHLCTQMNSLSPLDCNGGACSLIKVTASRAVYTLGHCRNGHWSIVCFVGFSVVDSVTRSQSHTVRVRYGPSQIQSESDTVRHAVRIRKSDSDIVIVW